MLNLVPKLPGLFYPAIFFIVSAIVSAGCGVALAKGPPPTLVLTNVPQTGTPDPKPTVTVTVTATATAMPNLLPTVTSTPKPTATPTPVILIGGGDIAACGEENMGDERTARILERFPEAAIFTTGDNVQVKGTWAEYWNCFQPSWGQFFDRIRPSPGNHDFVADGGESYYRYFGQQAGPPGLGYYSYDLGDWHIVALNSNCDIVACGPDSRQIAWLREDLENSDKQCTLLYWHHPRWSSGNAGGSGSVRTFWDTAVDFRAEIVVNGHDHDYERFARMDEDGNPDPNGVREFVVGTAGNNIRSFGEIKPYSEIRYNKTNGLIKFELFPDHYTWEYIVDSGNFTDKGSGTCQ